MKKSIHPAVGVVALVILLGVVGFLFYKGTATPDPVPMSPQGPGAFLLKKSGGGGAGGPAGGRRMSPDVMQAMKQQQQQPGGGQP
jgi:hypothetical protein